MAKNGQRRRPLGQYRELPTEADEICSIDKGQRQSQHLPYNAHKVQDIGSRDPPAVGIRKSNREYETMDFIQ